MKNFFWVALAGSFGAISRYGISLIINKFSQGDLPWATIIVNALGCFLFGVVFALSKGHFYISEERRFILLVGFMGAFTTFSAFAYENASFIKQSQWVFLSLNISIAVVTGIVFMLLGMGAGRLL